MKQLILLAASLLAFSLSACSTIATQQDPASSYFYSVGTVNVSIEVEREVAERLIQFVAARIKTTAYPNICWIDNSIFGEGIFDVHTNAGRNEGVGYEIRVVGRKLTISSEFEWTE